MRFLLVFGREAELLDKIIPLEYTHKRGMLLKRMNFIISLLHNMDEEEMYREELLRK